jgi:hypothetical protein
MGKIIAIRTNGVAVERLDVDDAAIGWAPHGRGVRGSIPRRAGQFTGRSRPEASAGRGVDLGLDVHQRARGGWVVKRVCVRNKPPAFFFIRAKANSVARAHWHTRLAAKEASCIDCPIIGNLHTGGPTQSTHPEGQHSPIDTPGGATQSTHLGCTRSRRGLHRLSAKSLNTGKPM